MSSVFVSYSRNDLESVVTLENQLASSQISFWRDQEQIYGGDRWPKVLGEAIAANDVVLLVWSKHSAASYYVEFEWCTALALKKYIIPWLLDQTPLPHSLMATNGLDASAGEPALKQLIKSLGKRVSAADAVQQDQVLEELGQIKTRQPKEAVEEAKNIFNQHHWIVQGDVYQAGRDLNITIQSPKKPRRAKPTILDLEPASVAGGEEVAIVGLKFGVYEISKSRLMIGPYEADVINWSDQRIQATVPVDLKPGSYPVSVQIHDLSSVSPSPLTVTLFPEETSLALYRGDQFLLLVAQIEADSEEQLLQADLLEQIRLAVEEKHELKDKLLIAAWPEKFSGPNALRLAQRVGGKYGAQLVLFGRMGEGRIFYPRLAVAKAEEHSFTRMEERLSSITAQERMVQQEQHLLSAEPIDRPVRLMHFITGWYQHEKGAYASARSNFLEVLKGEALSSIDQANFYFKAGDSCLMLGHEILERPYREEKDHQEGDNFLREGIEYLERSAQAYATLKDREAEASKVFVKLALAVSGQTNWSIGEKHQKAIAYCQKALDLLNCEKELEPCINAYGNLANFQEWYASVQWNRKENDDLLELSLENGQRALALLERKQEQLLEQGNVSATMQRIIYLERVWFKNNHAISKGQLYRGDRDANLEESIRDSKEALAEFKKEPDKMRGRIALTYNHIGRSYINLNRDNRIQNLRLAREALEQGITYVNTQHFPEFRQLLDYNLKLLADVEQRNNALPDQEVAFRFEAEFVQLLETGDIPAAEQSALAYLNWCWNRFASISMFTAKAHYEMGHLAERAGHMLQAVYQYQSARVILSAATRRTEDRMKFEMFLEVKLRSLWKQLGLEQNDVYQLNYHLLNQYKQEGDRYINHDPHTALKYYEAALSIYPLEPRILVNRSHVLHRLGDWEGYAQDLSNALLIHPKDGIARYNRSQIYILTNHWQDALQDLNVAVEADPEEVNFRLSRAECFEAIGNIEMALKDYEVALLKTSDPNARDQLQMKIKQLKVGGSLSH